MKGKRTRFFLLLTILTSLSVLKAQGTYDAVTIEATSLKNNILGIETKRTVKIYLPPSYSTSNISYPVVYFLSGFGDNGAYIPYFPSSMDKLIKKGQINEMIVVGIEGYYFLGGSFYVNSPITGNWDDYVSKDLVSFIDKNYRTLKSPASRAITGFSMGGFGAINVAMLHPDVFGIMYSMSPGAYDKNGLKNCQLFKSESFINQFITKEEEFSKMTPAQALTNLKSYATANNEDLQFIYAYGMAFSPNTKKNFPYIDYPYSKQGTNLVCDSTLLKNFENGYGNWVEKVKKYKANFQSLKSVTLEYGWIRTGTEYLSKLLKNEGIQNTLDVYVGGHGDKLALRVDENMLPTCARYLEFDPSVKKLTFSNSLLNSTEIKKTIPKNPGKYTFAFTIYNKGEKRDTITTAQVLPSDMPDSTFSIAPNIIYLAPQDSQKVTVTIKAGSLNVDQLYRTVINFTSKSNQINRAFKLIIPITISASTGIEKSGNIIPAFGLQQNYPNPFNPETVISYQLPEFSHVTLKVYDLVGREVATLVDELKQPGFYNSTFSILHYALASGIYFYTLRSGNYTNTKKLIVMK